MVIPAIPSPASATPRISYNLNMYIPLTLAITKTAAGLSRTLGRGGGGALPGLIADRLDKQLGRKLAAQIPYGVIIVTGTNGKTTTTKMIASALEASGERVLTNRSGSNLRRGVLSSLIDGADYRGRINATIALFEVDEASLRRVAPELQPRHIVVLNLFRDQLDRYGELDTTAALIGQGIASTKAKIYLNADDPLVASLAKYAAGPEQVNYFGIEGLPAFSTGSHQTATDSDRCPVCGNRLKFGRTFYGHIGHYSCPAGDFDRPNPSVAITGVERADLTGTQFTVAVDGKRYDGSLPLPGTYNLYNALAAIALCNGLKLEPLQFLPLLARTAAAFGRVERVELEGRTLYLLLVKNPAGFTQVLDTFLLRSAKPHVLMLINDDHADGRDVSWLWDVPLEALQPTGAVVSVGGVRASDMALRLKYAGIESVSRENIQASLSQFIAGLPVGETGYILPTYTAMIALRHILASQTDIQEVKI